jgi:hypothetical protein
LLSWLTMEVYVVVLSSVHNGFLLLHIARKCAQWYIWIARGWIKKPHYHTITIPLPYHYHTHVVICQMSPLLICRVWRRIWFFLVAPFSSPCWRRKRDWTGGWLKLVLCNSQCSHSEANWHTEWRRCQLSITAKNFQVAPSVGGLCELVY